MSARWLALALSMLLATAAYAEPAVIDPPAAAPKTEKPAKPKKAKPKKASKKPARDADKAAEAAKPAAGESRPAAGESRPAAGASKPAATGAKPAPDEPKTTTVDKLPGALKTVHVCAMPKATVEIDSERYAKSVVFFVSCTAMRGGLTPTAVYVARDAKGTGAKLVTFEGLGPEGAIDKLEMLYSVTPAREAYTKDGDLLPNRQVKNDTPWLVGAWAPDDRPGVCAIAATWRLQGDKGELYLWEEAKECPKGALPKYESKTDKKPPLLVGR